ncbi:MAG: cobD1 [Rhodocyclaceae bacterium]|nr:MAG: cobD1 [Rhodocyclaceae bacterium]TND01360.1 MAG: cobD1 [Rhodocyclaceae bacterium]
MTLISIVIALILEQVHALSVQHVVREPLARMAAFLEDKFNDGGRSHGAIAWGLGVALPAALLSIIYALLMIFQPLLGFLLGIGVLYLTMGFRQFSHFFTGIQVALRLGEVDQARELLAQWRRRSGDRLTAGEIARLAIEQALLSSHRHVFAPLLWFAVLGPAGALFYRLAHSFDEFWGERSEMEFGQFGEFAHQAFAMIDWVPLRVTAAAFAVVGDFEDAVHCWRTQAVRWPEAGSGILLASGAGALGVRLGMPVHDVIQDTGDASDRPELGLGEDADPDFMQSTIGLVWRSLVLGLAVLALVWISSWVGS